MHPNTRRIVRRLLTPLLLLVAAACASGRAQGEPTQRPRRDLLTQEQILESRERNVYSVVETLRSNWLRERGPDSLTREPTKVQAYLDGTRLGGVEALRNINVNSVAYIQYFDGNAASARWGLGHGQGVIYVASSTTMTP